MRRYIAFTVIIVIGLFFMGGRLRHMIETPEVAYENVETVKPVLTTSSPLINIVSEKPIISSSNHNSTNYSRHYESIRLFKSTNYPPQTAEEKALWEWWHAMDKNDPHFRWKMPIEFYGKVVDQFGEPVAHATVNCVWTTVVGPIPDPKKEILSGIDGRFSLEGVKGKGISIDILKEGYLSTDNSMGDFEYADFFEDNFHVPDPNNPVVFRLQRLIGAEPIYKYFYSGDIIVGGPPLILDVEKGKIASHGELCISVILGDPSGKYGPEYTVILKALNGAGCIFSSEEFLFMAPESGYRETISFTNKVEYPDYRHFKILRFYIRTSTKKYVAAEIEITLLRNMKTADFTAILFYNPSGSRNLEFDHRKWINRKR